MASNLVYTGGRELVEVSLEEPKEQYDDPYSLPSSQEEGQQSRLLLLLLGRSEDWKHCDIISMSVSLSYLRIAKVGVEVKKRSYSRIRKILVRIISVLT